MNEYMYFWNSLRMLFQCGHFDRNEISFWMIKYHVNTTQNEMPTHVHQNIGSFWNVTEMKCQVNRTCFHTGLKSQTVMSSFHLSCERTVNTLGTWLKFFIKLIPLVKMSSKNTNCRNRGTVMRATKVSANVQRLVQNTVKYLRWTFGEKNLF